MKSLTLSQPANPPAYASSTLAYPVVGLVSRTILFLAWQAAIALVIALSGGSGAWEASAAWWPVTATLTNIVSIGLLVFWFRREGARYRALFHVERETWKQDLKAVAGVALVSAVLAILPNFGLAIWLFGDAQVPADMLFRALPAWAVWISLAAFPITIALAELPTYFGYVMPRLGQGTRAVLLAAFFLGIQHATLPLLFDWRFILWRAGMFLPFALCLAVVLRWRPRLLPYLVVVHGLLDLQAVLMVLPLSY